MAIKDLFFKSEDVSNIPSQPVQQNQPDVVNQVNNINNVSVTTPQVSISSNDSIVEKIWSEIINKNLPGPDYLELKNNISALDGMPLTDEQKLISSYNILKKNYPSFNKDVILKSIDTYINIVNEEKVSGLNEVAKLKAEKIDKKEELINSLKSKADALKKEYDDIMKQIEEHSTSIASERLSINNSETMFIASVDTVLNTLNSDKLKISNITL